jgi:hemolysin activation/secretion protein
MRCIAPVCAIAIACGAAPVFAAEADGGIRRIELAGDIVARESLERDVAVWARSTEDQAIQALSRTLVQRLAEQGYVGAQVSASLRDGTLWLLVQVKRLGALELSSNLGARREEIRERFLAAMCGEVVACARPVVDLRKLKAATEALNLDLGVKVHAEVEPTPGDPDQFDVFVVVPRQASVEASLDNHGMASTGRYRAGALVKGRNLLLAGDSISLQATYSGKGLTAASAELEAPLPWRGLRLGLTASHLGYALGGEYEVLGYSGVADEFGLSISAPLVSGPRRTLIARADAGWKSTSNTIAILGTSSAARNLAGSASVVGAWRWSDPSNPTWGGGFSQFSAGLEVGRLQLLDAQSRTFDALTARTAGDYGKLSFRLQHDQELQSGVALTARMRGALASRNLDPSEKFVLTGPEAARAFPSGRITADDAVLATLEARLPIRVPYEPLSVSVSVFADAGGGRVNHRPWFGYDGPATVRLADAGVALSFSLARRLNGSVTAAAEVGAPQIAGRRSTLISFSLNGSY